MDTVSKLTADQSPDFTSTLDIEEHSDTEHQKSSGVDAGLSSEPTASLPQTDSIQHGGDRAQRGPLPPAPIDELSPASSNQQPSSTRELENHHGLNAPYSYKHHDPQTPTSDGSSQCNPAPESTPPPVPVSRESREENIERE